MQFRIEVLPQSKARRYACDVPWAAIQIGDSLDDLPRLNKVQQVDMLQVAFVDDDQPIPNQADLIRMTDQHAHQILDFVERNQHRIQVLMIHCFAGCSRSPAVAAALSQIHGVDGSEYFIRHYPNRGVFDRILRVHRERQDALGTEITGQEEQSDG